MNDNYFLPMWVRLADRETYLGCQDQWMFTEVMGVNSITHKKRCRIKEEHLEPSVKVKKMPIINRKQILALPFK